MNFWTEKSAEYAQQRNYLDELYRVYPISPNIRSELSFSSVENITRAFDNRDNKELLRQLLSLDKFPIKDSYVAFLRKDTTAMSRNPQTVNRIAETLYQMGLDKIFDSCTEPKESNRQIGPMFKNWINSGVIGAPCLSDEEEFLNSTENCIFNASDAEMKRFANTYLGYNRNKGLDFLAKFNNKYILAEAKFITDFGGHQNGQFDDAVSTMQTSFDNRAVDNEVIAISIMDGVLYIRGQSKMYRYLVEHSEQTIISALLLREFLYSL